MDKDFKTTFIPKRNLSDSGEGGGKKRRRSGNQSIFGLIAILLAITTILSVAGVYLFQAKLTSDINSRIESLNRVEKAFEPSLIVELKKLDIRLRAGTDLLNNHVALSGFFQSFSEATLPDVQFNGIDLDLGGEVPQASLTGEARGYLPLAQQSDLFEENRYIQNPIFSNFSNTDIGRVSFSLEFSLDPELLLYNRLIQENVGAFGLQESLNTNSNNQEPFDPNETLIDDQRDILPGGTDIDFLN